MLITCPGCSLPKALSDYYLKRTGHREKLCKTCYKDRTERARFPRMYGITLEDFQKMLESQGGVCAICGELETDIRKHKLSLDHCHVTGKVRGILCNRCNKLLGHAQDSPEILMRAAGYLRRFRQPEQCEVLLPARGYSGERLDSCPVCP